MSSTGKKIPEKKKSGLTIRANIVWNWLMFVNIEDEINARDPQEIAVSAPKKGAASNSFKGIIFIK